MFRASVVTREASKPMWRQLPNVSLAPALMYQHRFGIMCTISAGFVYWKYSKTKQFYQQKLAAVENRLSESRQAIEHMHMDAADRAAELAKAVKENKRVAEAKAAVVKAKEATQEKYDALKQKMDENKNVGEKMKASFDEAKNMLNTYRMRQENMEKEILSGSNREAELLQEVRELKKKLDAAHAEMTLCQENVASLQKMLPEVQPPKAPQQENCSKET